MPKPHFRNCRYFVVEYRGSDGEVSGLGAGRLEPLAAEASTHLSIYQKGPISNVSGAVIALA